MTAINNEHWVHWVEPYAEGPEPVYLKMKIGDIITNQRRIRPQYESESDETILSDFVALHWASYTEIPDTGD